jgi:mannose-6-phosphate isomerase-like protein (cupin superfamily)
MLVKIKTEDKLIAIIIRADYSKEGIEFFTPDEFSQQLAYMNRPAGYTIMPHVHNPVPREVHFTQEVLLIRKGKVKVDFYTQERKYLESKVLSTGDVILLADGGHGFTILEPTEMIEIKQGPYLGEHDKTKFDHDTC